VAEVFVFLGRCRWQIVELTLALSALGSRVSHDVFVNVTRDGVLFGTVLREVLGRILNQSNAGQFGVHEQAIRKLLRTYGSLSNYRLWHISEGRRHSSLEHHLVSAEQSHWLPGSMLISPQ
jgi:hypothetical protein